MTRKYPLFLAVTGLILLLASCGGGSVSLYVTQEGTTLIVDSGRYERRPDLYLCDGGVCIAPASNARYAAGQVVVYFDKADAIEAAALIAGLGLSVIAENDLATEYFLQVAVPPLSEEQWVQALRNQPLVTAAYTNDFLYLAVSGDQTARMP